MKTIIHIRNYYPVLSFLILVLFLVGCKEKNETTSSDSVVWPKEPAQSELTQKPVIKDEKLKTLFDGYLAIKSSLVSSKAEEVVQDVKKILALKVVEEGPIFEVLQGMLVPELDGQRKYFSEFGTLMEPLLAGQIQSGYIYKQFCPMAFQNNGGYWLSNSRTIQNPYFGSAMLTCGVVVSELQPE